MVDVVRKLNSFNAVAAGNDANVSVAAGPSYAMLWINTDAAIADMTRVLFTLNAEPVVDCTAQQLVDLYKHLVGVAPSANWIPIILRDPSLYPDGQESTELVTGPGDNLHLSVTIDGASAVTFMKGWSVTQPGRAERRVIPRIQVFSWVPGATGRIQYTDLPRGPRYLQMLLGDGSNGDVDDIRVDRDKVTLFEAPVALNDEMATTHQREPLGAKKHAFNFVRRGMIEDALQTNSQELVLDADVSTAGQIPIILRSLQTDRVVFTSRQSNGNGGGNGRRNRQGRR